MRNVKQWLCIVCVKTDEYFWREQFPNLFLCDVSKSKAHSYVLVISHTVLECADKIDLEQS